MPYTESDLAAVRAAIAKGEQNVQFADRSVTYRSVEELLQAENRISRSLAAAAATPRAKQVYGVASKGF